MIITAEAQDGSRGRYNIQTQEGEVSLIKSELWREVAGLGKVGQMARNAALGCVYLCVCVPVCLTFSE